MSKMKITGAKGIHFEYENGITVSIQFGKGDACSNRKETEFHVADVCTESENASVCVWETQSSHDVTEGVKLALNLDDIDFHSESNIAEMTRVSPEDVTKILDFCSKLNVSIF